MSDSYTKFAIISPKLTIWIVDKVIAVFKSSNN